MYSKNFPAWLGQGLTAVLVTSYVLMLVAALQGSVVLFGVAAAATYVADGALHGCGARQLARMRSCRFGLVMRFVLRQVLLLALVAMATGPGDVLVPVTVAGLMALQPLQDAYYAVALRIKRKRRLHPVDVQGLEVPGSAVAALPPRLFYRHSTRKILHLDLLLTTGILTGLATGVLGFAVAGTALAVAATAVTLAVFVWRARACLRTPDAETVLAGVNQALDAYRPEVALYFSFAALPKNFMYQVNMWLKTLESLEHRPVLILRERAMLARLAPTTVPVVCVPKAEHLARLDMGDLRVVLYPGNAGKNVHMLQRAHLKHVFIGHGDSDKQASSNRVSKVYDEIWVAGPAGRERYRRTGHAISPGSIVEVGRPQLGAITPYTGKRPCGMPTVLYAPTWEGWTDDACYTSLTGMGETLVAALLAQREPVRVIYRPHPLTGTRSPAAAAAHRAVLALLEEDNLRRHGGPAPLRPRSCELARLHGRFTELTRHDFYDAARLQDLQGRTAAARSLAERWEALYWETGSADLHRAVTSSRPGLYSCFNQADVLISDISSVVTDFLHSAKPYAITNPHDTPADTFRARNPAADAAYLISPDSSGLVKALAAARCPGLDTLFTDRLALKSHLLGPSTPSSTERFTAEVNRLCTPSTPEPPDTDPSLQEPSASPAQEMAHP
ncbi:hypothetical protein ACFY2W_15060 [Streptomyces sp. NPDC001262]|uniref:hypothetical protein n=1 Tax=unclassified Streptomyces TaxID=2593676 RepID=UPI0036B16022